MMEKDMQLPAGKTCGDCQYFSHCRGMFGCDGTNTTCDWSPSRFALKVDEPERDTRTIDMFEASK